ncbi:MAG TPA: MBL fold metallo-hydrolase [Frankiaceae bacterium]|nr:MBL fold metallo-hydrolase [Frankiaceae bacterium]
MEYHRPIRDVTVLNDHAVIPGIGVLPVNAFVLHAEQPMVIDTGLGTPDKHFLDDLATVIDPADVRWIYLTHPDRDHTGGLFDLLDAAPEARIVTTFFSVGIMSSESPLPLERLYLLNPGQSFHLGDRRISAFRPPVYDSPATTGFLDESTGACFVSDCFGAPLASVEMATADEVGAIDDDELRAAQLLWSSVDSPWVQSVSPATFGRALDPLRLMDPELVLSSHLPPAAGRISELLDTLAMATSGTPFLGPDQQALEAMLAAFAPGPPAQRVGDEAAHTVR